MKKHSALLLIIALLPVVVSADEGASPVLRGDLDTHDPSTIVQCDGTNWVFGTGRGIRSLYSTNLLDWRAGPPVFDTSPAWTAETIPGNRGRFWAPDVIHLKDRYLLYYSVSTFGSRNSAIGLAVTRSLNPLSPGYRWEDKGQVVRTAEKDSYNAIDPSVMQDRNGRLWLAFGSYWSGIKLIELDPATGLRIATNSPMHSLAWHSSIEAASLARHDNFYYLFVNWGECCRGVNSTYEIRVGRSAEVTGPYLDQDGRNLTEGGGTAFLRTSGDYIGPGHAGVFQSGEAQYLGYHFYNRARFGRSMLDILPLNWTADGWPKVTARPAK